MGRIRAPRDDDIESLEPVEHTLCGNRDFASVVQLRILIKLVSLSWIIRVGLMSSQGPHKREEKM